MNVMEMINEAERRGRLASKAIFGNEDCWKIFANDIYKQLKKENQNQGGK